jgi:hypothetical protein
MLAPQWTGKEFLRMPDCRALLAVSLCGVSSLWAQSICTRDALNPNVIHVKEIMGGESCFTVIDVRPFVVFGAPPVAFIDITTTCGNQPPQYQSYKAVGESTEQEIVDSFCPDGVPTGRAARRAVAHASTAPRAFGHASSSFATGDLNGDGTPDAAAVSSSTVYAQLLDANGKQTSVASYSLPAPGSTLILADLNGDGKLDIAVTLLNSPGGVAVLLGNGNGTFSQPKVYSAGADAVSVAAADFNGDGKIDLAVSFNALGSGTNGGVAVLFGNGDGTFRIPAIYSAGALPVSLVALDFNGDGKPDIATANSLSGDVSVLLNRGDGTFGAPLNTAANGAPGGNAIAYADLNNDGNPDLAIAYTNLHTAAILLGKGNGTFQAPVQYVAGQPASIAVLPTLDGAFAMLTSDFLGQNLLVTPGTAQGSLQAPVVQYMGSQLQSVLLAEVNQDYKLDAIVEDLGAQSVIVLAGDGAGNLTPLATSPMNAPGGFTPQFANIAVVADLNHDGLPDVIMLVANGSSGGVGVMLGRSGGQFAAMAVTPTGARYQSIVTGDFNGDSKPDLALGTGGSIAVLMGNGDGTFRAPTQIAIPGGPDLAVGDFNGDGKLDLFVAGRSPTVLLGNGSGGFSAPLAVSTGNQDSLRPVVADMNGDGIPDVVLAVTPDDFNFYIAVLQGNGNGTFQALPGPPVETPPTQIVLADLNVDGHPDVVIAHCCGLADATYLLGNGDGTLQAETHVQTGPAPQSIAAGDLNGDGRPDVVSIGNSALSTGSSGAVVVLLNGGAPSGPAAVSVYPAGGGGSSQTFTFMFFDSNGYENLAVADILINSALDGRQACYVAFAPSGATSGSVLLVDDGGDAGGPFSTVNLPGSQTASNSHCTINAAGSSISATGSVLALKLAVAFSASFAGNKIIYAAARETAANSGWRVLGTWNVPFAAGPGPSVTGLAPLHIGNPAQTYTFTFSDTNGWQDITVANVLVNSALDGRQACYVAIVPASSSSGSVFLVDNTGDAGGPFTGITLPGTGTAANSQCTVNGAGSSISGNGNALTVNLSLRFNQSFAGNQVFFLAARSNTANSGWQAVGSVSVP